MEPSVFDYWLASNMMNYQWQLNLLRASGIDGHLDGEVVTFFTEADTELANFLKGKSFNVLTWTEVVDTITDAEPVAQKKRRNTVVDVPVEPTPVVEEKKVDDVTSPAVPVEPQDGAATTTP